jgi:hypothetical protein
MENLGGYLTWVAWMGIVAFGLYALSTCGGPY